MAWQDDLITQAVPSASATMAPPRQAWEQDLLDVQTSQPHVATGVVESIKAGYQGSATGMMLRGKLPELVMDPEASKWWERALTGTAQVVSELPEMIVGAMAGAPAGTAIGGAITGPAAPAGAVVGGILGAGAGMFAVPGALRESLIQAYKTGEISTVSQFLDILKEVVKTTGKEALVGAATFGAGAVAARVAGKALVPAIGQSITVPTATKAIGAADVVAQIGAMTTVPAALEGRLPHLQEILDAAIVIGGLKTAHVAANRIASTFAKTSKTPAEVVADSRQDTTIRDDLTEPEPFVGPPRPPDQALRYQEQLFIETTRMDALEAVREPSPEQMTQLNTLRARVAELESRIEREIPAAQLESSLKRVYDDVHRQMLYAGRPEAEAAAIGVIERERYRARSDRLGLDPWSLYSEAALRIRGPEEPPATPMPPLAPVAPEAKVSHETLPEISIEKKSLRPLTDPDVKSLVEMMGDEAGWETIGGKLDVGRYVAEGGTLDEFGRPTKLGITAFTQWIPRAEWWRDRPGPGKLNEKQVRAAIRKAIDGEPLTKREQRTIDFLVEVANGRIAAEREMGAERWNGVSRELVDEQIDPTTKNVVDADRVAKAAEKDPDAVERAAVQWENNDAAFMAEIRRILGEQGEETPRGGEAGESGQTLYQLGELQRYLAWRDGIAYERRLFGGTLDSSYLGTATREQRSEVTQARERYNLARLALGLDQIADWLRKPEGLIQDLPQPPRFEQQGTLFQRTIEDVRGSYVPSENLIRIFKNADESTALHELGHTWLEEMRIDAQRPDAPAQLKADWSTLRQELAIPEKGDIPTPSHEMFARSVERYAMEGKAPSAELAGVFQRFKEWLIRIYRSLTELNVEPSPAVREILDRMLATDAQLEAAREMGIPRAYVDAARAETGRKIVPGFVAEQVSMQPFADELPRGPGEAPDTSHVNYKYINTPWDVKLTMQRMAELDQEAIQKQRGGARGVKSWEEANAEQAKYIADVLGGGPDTLRILTPRDPAAGPDVRLGVMKKLMTGAARESARLRDTILEKGPNATVQEQLEYMGSIERARMLQAEFLGERAGVARALNALKDATEGSGDIGKMLDIIGVGTERILYQTAKTEAELVAEMKAKLDEIMLNYRGKTVYDIAKLHKEIGTLKGMYKFAKDTTQATKWEMVVEGWKSSLLSGPVTHTTNLFGTGAYHALRAPVDALAAGIGMLRGAKVGVGEADRASMQESIARLTGMLGGTIDGLKVGYHVFKMDELTGKTESYREAIPGKAGPIIRIPLRLMGAEDAIVSTMYTRGELKVLAVRQAFEERLSPLTREFAERVDRLMEQPTPEMLEAAQSEATRMTFNAPLGEKGRTLQLFVNRWNLQWMLPFVRTPINIFKEVVRLTPAAPAIAEWRAAIAKGGVARDRALAELALGTGIMAVTMAYAFDGKISGQGEPDPGKRRAKAGTWQPYSINPEGDTWFEYRRIEPLGTLMGLAADLAAVWDHTTDEEKDKIPKMLAFAFSNAITEKTWLQGVTNVVNALSDPTRFAPRFAQQMAGSMVPNIIGQTTTMTDPLVREVNGAIEAIQARIPGMREELLPKRDWLGQPIETKERLGLISPIRMQDVSQDKVRLEADRLNISVGTAPKKIHIGRGTGKLGDVEITPEQRNTFAEVSGNVAHEALTSIVNAPTWDDLPDLAKRRVYARVLRSAHRAGAIAAFPPELREIAAQQITEKMQVELAPAGP